MAYYDHPCLRRYPPLFVNTEARRAARLNADDAVAAAVHVHLEEGDGEAANLLNSAANSVRWPSWLENEHYSPGSSDGGSRRRLSFSGEVVPNDPPPSPSELGASAPVMGFVNDFFSGDSPIARPGTRAMASDDLKRYSAEVLGLPKTALSGQKID